MLLLLALLSMASAKPQFAYYIGGYPYGGYHPYGAAVRHVYAPTVYTHPGPYIQPYIQPQAAEDDEDTAVARSDFDATFRSPEQQPRFLIDVRYARTGSDGAGTLNAAVGLHQNFLVANGGAYLTIKLLVGVFPASTSYLVAVVKADNACALTAPGNSPADLDAFHTAAPFSLASVADGTAADGEIVGVFTTGSLPSAVIQTSALKYLNADGSGMFPAITAGNRYAESVRLRVNADLSPTSTAADTGTVSSASYVSATGLKVMIWQLADGLDDTPTAGNLGCGTLMETPIAPIL